MLYNVLRFFTVAFLKVFFPYKIIGKKDALQSSCLIVSNHLSNCDAFIVGSVFKGKIYALAKKESFKNKLAAWFMRKVGGIPIDRDKPDPTTLISCIKLLRNGERLLLFPEGTRNKTGEGLLPFKSGAAMLAVKGKVAVQPIYISRKSKLFRRNYVIVGAPLLLDEYQNTKLTPEIIAEIDDKIRSAVIETGNLPVKVKKSCK